MIWYAVAPPISAGMPEGKALHLQAGSRVQARSSCEQPLQGGTGMDMRNHASAALAPDDIT
ncbi:MAG: hypothetical protein ACO1SX_13770, partial [Actinomycetota bacterium]